MSKPVIPSINNEPVIFGTDTVYALACLLEDQKSLQTIFLLKKRPLDQALPVLCADLNQAELIAYLSEDDRKLIDFFSPGALTYVAPSRLRAGQTIAFRIPKDAFLMKLMKKVGPLWATSLNPHGQAPLDDPEVIQKVFPNIPIIYTCVGSGASSTIIHLPDLKILRQGDISYENISKFIKEEHLYENCDRK